VTVPAAGLVLAAGLSTRFGSDKLMAPFRRRPLLQHALDAAMAARLQPVVVVVAGEPAGIDWHGAQRLVNPQPERGLASSLRLGLAALAAGPAERAVILLGDQPLVSAAAIRALLAAAGRAPIVVPRYAAGGPRNPVVVGRAAWPLADHLTGDAGYSQLFADRPELVALIDVAGANPDVDTPADLARISRGA
jgi:CTP:molybdopterin cytidylyltransferase MocA